MGVTKSTKNLADYNFNISVFSNQKMSQAWQTDANPWTSPGWGYFRYVCNNSRTAGLNSVDVFRLQRLQLKWQQKSVLEDILDIQEIQLILSKYTRYLLVNI